VGGRELRDHSIDPVKLDARYISGTIRAWASVGAGGRLFAGGGKPRVASGVPYPGAYEIKWGRRVSSTCATVATINSNHSPATERVPVPGNPSSPFTAGYAVVYSFGGATNATFVNTFNQQGQLTPLGFDVTVTC
jgi:hypothetical protein